MIAVKRPTLIINEDIVRNNIHKMVAKVQDTPTVLRPHFKTHHSIAVGEWFQEAGVDRITVSSVSMAQYFADGGWKDILIAFPYNPLEANELNELAKRIKLSVLIESEESLAHLINYTDSRISYYIKIDVGTHRTGLELKDIDKIKKLISGNDKILCEGILAHAGHSYRCRSEEEIKEVYQNTVGILKQIKSEIDRKELKISFGDTPTCSVMERFEDIDEIRPGNFVYYDLMQEQITSARLEDIGVSLACPVVALHPDRNEVVIYGGAVHLSKEALRIKDQMLYGIPVKYTEDGWEIIEGAWLDRLSQEHGILKAENESLSDLKTGDVVGVLPVHSCLTADLMTSQQTLEGTIIEKMSKI